jgi:hypothetical protein
MGRWKYILPLFDGRLSRKAAEAVDRSGPGLAMSSFRMNTSQEREVLDLRPHPVMAVGMTGTCDVGNGGGDSLQAAVTVMLRAMALAFKGVVTDHPEYFSAASPIVRFVTTAADGAGLAGARAAQDCNLELACISPFGLDEYLNDFTGRSVSAVKAVLETANVWLVLPGSRAEGARAYERASDVILASVDVLIAVRNENDVDRHSAVHGVVRSALLLGIPVIGICPTSLSAELAVAVVRDELSLPVGAAVSGGQHEPIDLPGMIERTMSPPSSSFMRRKATDLAGEPARPLAMRFEYALLQKVFGVSRVRTLSAGYRETERVRLQLKSKGQGPAPDQKSRYGDLEQRTQRIDLLANHYGRLTRSSATSKFLVIIVIAFLSAAIGLAFPTLSDASIVVQMVVNGLVILDTTVSRRRRWVERWLDYRAIAEGLRSSRFLHPLGLGDIGKPVSRHLAKKSWVDWYVRRCVRALDAPSGVIDAARIADIAANLVGREIDSQLDYHRRAFRQLGRLERRLYCAAYAALALAIVVAAGVTIATYVLGASRIVEWQPAALLALAVFPAATTAFNGIRADAELLQLVERSASMTTGLSRLRRMLGKPLNYDLVALTARSAGALMNDELSEWRLMLENRRLRQFR